MRNIKEIFDNAKGLYGYRIIENNVSSYELFFVHKNLETVRSTDSKATYVTVYTEHDGRVGDSAFQIYQSMSEEDINRKIEEATARANLVSNEPYELVDEGTLNAELPTNLDKYEPKELGRLIADAVYAADTVPGGSINALEIFIYKDVKRVINSRGVDKTQTSYRVMIEAIPTFTDDKQSVELYEDYRFTVFEPEKLTAEIAEKMREVSDRARAQKPGKELNINVVLRPHEIVRLAAELAHDQGYGSIYMHANLHKEGDNLQEGDCDKLNITMKSIIAGSERSAYFDDDGAQLFDTEVVKDGIVCGSFGSSRFGQYLKVERPSGDLKCISVGKGTLTDEEIKAEPYIECVSMSGLQLDLYNDYIGGEIRLAYYFDGEKTTPITGITMSAKLSEVLSSLRLSEKTDVSGAYEGPVKALLRGVSVL